jgi:hypothetical protein
MLSPEEAYKYDNTFRHIVDIMRAELSVYRITPAELRQAALLAATMHEMERVRPLFIKYPYTGPPEMPPAMFGDLQGCGNTASGYAWAESPKFYGAETGRTDSSKENLSNTPKECSHYFLHMFGNGNYRICVHCNLSDVYANAFNVPCKP